LAIGGKNSLVEICKYPQGFQLFHHAPPFRTSLLVEVAWTFWDHCGWLWLPGSVAFRSVCFSHPALEQMDCRRGSFTPSHGVFSSLAFSPVYCSQRLIMTSQ
jgi:hypothetical protein